MSESSVVVRFGGSTSGLDAAVAVAKAQLAGFNSELRYLAREAAASGGAVDAELTKALHAAAAGAAGMQKELKSLTAKPVNEVAAATKNFNAQLDKIALFAWNNTSLSGNTIERVVNPIKGLANTIGVVPTIAAAAAAALAALAYATGSFAENQLTKLGEVAKETGLNTNQIQGAKVVGAAAGLDSDAMVAGLKNASKEFAQFGRNAGEVKDSLEKVDEEFLKVADKAKTSGEFIDIVGQKIRALPREEGVDLVNALFGDGTGEKLYGPIVRGELEMKKLGDAAKEAGVALDDGVAKAAAESKRKVDEIAELANGKLLHALQGLAAPVAAMKTEWYRVVEAASDATVAATKFVGELNQALESSRLLNRENQQHQTGGASFQDVFGGYRRARVNETGTPEGPKAPGQGSEEVGVSRARYAARDADEDKSKKAKGSKGDTDAISEARKEIDGEIEAVKQQTAINKQQYELDAANKKISEDQKKALVLQADDQELVSIKALYEQEKQIAGQKPAQIAEINNKLEALEAQHTLKMLQEQTKAAQESARVWNEEAQQMAATLTSSLSQAIEGMVEHTKTKDVGKKLAQSLFNELTNDLVKNTLTEPLKLALQPLFQGLTGAISQPLQQGLRAAIQPISSSITGALGGAASGAADAAGGAALTGAATALTAAATALSAAAAGLGAGGAAAGAGGAAASGGGFFSALAGLLPAFDTGSFQLPSLGNFDGKGGFPAFVHPGEMIVPAGPAGPMRQALKGARAGAGGSSTQVSAHTSFHISATDSQDVHRWLTGNQRQVAKAMEKLANNGAMLGRRRF